MFVLQIEKRPMSVIEHGHISSESFFRIVLISLVHLIHNAHVVGLVASRTGNLHDGISWVASTASLRDSWVSLVTWSAKRSGGRPLGAAP